MKCMVSTLLTLTTVTLYITPCIVQHIAFDFQKPTQQQLAKWADLLRSDASILEKFVSHCTIPIVTFAKSFSCFTFSVTCI